MDSFYIYFCITNSVYFVPHFYSSDQNEQGYAFVRTGQYSSRRTNVAHINVIEGLMRQNRTKELIEPADLVEESKKTVPIVHTRRRTVIGDVAGDKIIHLHGCDISPDELFDTMQEATAFACHMVNKLPGVVCPINCDENYKLDSLEFKICVKEY